VFGTQASQIWLFGGARNNPYQAQSRKKPVNTSALLRATMPKVTPSSQIS
jgi:hypothetical protein